MKRALVFLSAALLLMACSPSAAPHSEAALPTAVPTETAAPIIISVTVTSQPTEAPTPAPTAEPTEAPTPELTAEATKAPTPEPTPEPTPRLITDEELASGVYDSYFNDALLVGDSLTWTYSHYVRNVRNEGKPDFLGNVKFLASVSMSIRRASYNVASESEVSFQYGSHPISLTDGVNRYGAKKVFLMLGLNDLAVRKWDDVQDNFRTVIRLLQEKCPTVETIVIMGVLPVTTKFYDRQEPAWNTFNPLLEAVCQECGVTFLSFAEEVMDEDGYLDIGYCSDGKCHLNIEGEDIWTRCLRRYAASVAEPDAVFEPVETKYKQNDSVLVTENAAEENSDTDTASPKAD